MEKPRNLKKFFENSQFVKASGSRKGGDGGTPVCVEVAQKDGYIGVRDSKNPNGPLLCYTAQEWEVFIAGVKNGEFDRINNSL